jgi:hypothetical protein
VHVDQQLSYINIFMQKKIIEKLDETIARLDGSLAENNKAPTLWQPQRCYHRIPCNHRVKPHDPPPLKGQPPGSAKSTQKEQLNHTQGEVTGYTTGNPKSNPFAQLRHLVPSSTGKPRYDGC